MAGPGYPLFEGNNLIYGLIDPRTKELRYIGQTTRGIKQLRVYFIDSFMKKKRHVASWIKNLHTDNLKPEVIILEDSIKNKENLNNLEVFYISYFKSIGCNLTNLAEGGNSNSGFKLNKKQKKIWSKNAKNNTKLQEARKEYFDNNPHPKWHNNPNSEKYKDQLRSWSEQANKKAVEKQSIKVKDNNGIIYSSIAEAARKLNVCDSEISEHLKGRRKKVKGYTFTRIRYAGE